MQTLVDLCYLPSRIILDFFHEYASYILAIVDGTVHPVWLLFLVAAFLPFAFYRGGTR